MGFKRKFDPTNGQQKELGIQLYLYSVLQYKLSIQMLLKILLPSVASTAYLERILSYNISSRTLIYFVHDIYII